MPNAVKVTKPSKTRLATPSTSCRLDTPPNSPTLSPSKQTFTVELAKQVIETIKLIQASQAGTAPTEISPTAEPEDLGNAQPAEARARASRLQFKTVDEVYAPSELQV